MSDATLKVCETCVGSEALIADLEDLCPLVGVRPKLTECLDRCKSGPNCEVRVSRGSDRRGGRFRQVLTERYEFDDSLEILELATGVQGLQLSEDVQRRARLRSDAMRRLGSGLCNKNREELEEADALLSEALALEAASASPPPARSGKPIRTPTLRAAELRFMRGRVRGSPVMARYQEALADLDEALRLEPAIAQAWLEKASVLRRLRRSSEAIPCLETAIDVGSSQAPPPHGHGLMTYTKAWVERRMGQLRELALQEARVASGQVGGAHAGDASARDSGDGSGWWKLEHITGLSWDTCLYHLRNHPPAAPHPRPHDLWHVRVWFGNSSREYTPVSTAQQWESGELVLLVKTYVDGEVSSRFAMLQPALKHMDPEERRCWLQVSAPLLTLDLSQVHASAVASATPSAPGRSQDRAGSEGPQSVAFVAGGTGIAPALQLMREVAGGLFGPDCNGTLLYSSRTQQDIYMAEALAELEEQTAGRVRVCHTLTDEGGERRLGTARAALQLLPDKHHHFLTQAAGSNQSAKPRADALHIGRIDAAMLTATIPEPGPRVRVMVSGPPGMWEDVKAHLFALGHSEESLTELKAFSSSCSSSSEVAATVAAGPAEEMERDVKRARPNEEA